MMNRTMASDTTPLALVNVPSQHALLSDLRDHLLQSKGFCVATLNLDHVVKLRKEPAFRAAYLKHSHVTADGKPIVWLQRLSGHHVSLVTGSDLVNPLAGLCAETGTPVALVGSTEEVLARAGKVLATRHPALSVAIRIAPKMGFDPESPNADALIAEVEASGAGLCLLAFGAPKQEILAARMAVALPRIGIVSVGAGLDFLAGAQIRAPRIFRSVGAEWVWRLLQNPRRMAKRYAACALALPCLTGHAVGRRVSSSARSEGPV